MTDKKALATLYVDGEGRPHLDACMAATFEHCRQYKVNAIVIYTWAGEGPVLALERFLEQPDFAHIRIVAVTPPAQKTYLADPRAEKSSIVRTGITGERRRRLTEAGVPIVSARLPFRPVAPDEGLTDPMQLVDRALGVLGGGLSLCVQAALMACDAGAVAHGERIAAMSADTAVVLVACQSETFLSPKRGMLVEHIICRPSLYDISKALHETTIAAQLAKAPPADPQLVEAIDVPALESKKSDED